MKYLVVVLFVFGLSLLGSTVIFNTPSVSAHQSGCHSWHSCPSDSGSYTCGDTGYTSGCGDYTYTSPVMNYTSQGLDNGKKHAYTDEVSIESVAQNSGTAEGTSDGQSETLNLPDPQSTLTCKKSFTFQSPKDLLYVSGYESGYQSVCSATFDKAYKLAYETSYSSAKIAHQALLAKELAKRKSTENTIWTWIILSGIGILIIGSTIRNSRNH